MTAIPEVARHRRSRTRLPTAALFALGTTLAEVARAQPEAPDGPVVRESRREFLDSLADASIAPDPTQLYRRNGVRREVDLGRGWSAVLDERPPPRIDSPINVPVPANQLSRIAGVQVRRPGLFDDVAYGRTSVTRDAGSSLRWELFERVSLIADWHHQKSIVELFDARRQDASLGLRWRPEAVPDGWLDLGLHRAILGPSSETPLPGASVAPEGSETFWRARARWQPQGVPGLGLGAVVERAVSEPDGPLGASPKAMRRLRRSPLALRPCFPSRVVQVSCRENSPASKLRPRRST